MKRKTTIMETELSGIAFTVDNYGNLSAYGHEVKQAEIAGYMYYTGNGTMIPVHRIVANAFCDKGSGYEQVDHINNVKTDNRASNLRWTTRSANNARLHKRRLQSKNHKCTSHKGEVLEVIEVKTGEKHYSFTWQSAALHFGVTRQALIRAWNGMNNGTKTRCKWKIKWIPLSEMPKDFLKEAK